MRKKKQVMEFDFDNHVRGVFDQCYGKWFECDRKTERNNKYATIKSDINQCRIDRSNENKGS